VQQACSQPKRGGAAPNFAGGMTPRVESEAGVLREGTDSMGRRPVAFLYEHQCAGSEDPQLLGTARACEPLE